MSKEIYCLLILCGILCMHQILADESSDYLVRNKRVINLEEGGDVPLLNGDAPFIVNIKEINYIAKLCVGVILSKHTVVTVAKCVLHHDTSAIKLFIGAAHYNRGAEYNVIEKKIHIGNHQRRNNDGIALLTVAPAIVFDVRTSPIQLYEGLLLPGMEATIFGWGCNPKKPYGTNHRDILRSITVPIMKHSDCVNSYRGHTVISDNDICTYDPNKKCGDSDTGAPLVVDNHLVGLYLWRLEGSGNVGHNRPDVFVVLQSLEYGSWIRNNIVHNIVHAHRS